MKIRIYYLSVLVLASFLFQNMYSMDYNIDPADEQEIAHLLAAWGECHCAPEFTPEADDVECEKNENEEDLQSSNEQSWQSDDGGSDFEPYDDYDEQLPQELIDDDLTITLNAYQDTKVEPNSSGQEHEVRLDVRSLHSRRRPKRAEDEPGVRLAIQSLRSRRKPKVACRQRKERKIKVEDEQKLDSSYSGNRGREQSDYRNAEGLFACEWGDCQKIYKNVKNFYAHVHNKHYRDLAQTSLKCEWGDCQQVCSMKGNLKTHLRVHTGESPFGCPYPGCDRSFKQSGELDTHVRRHEAKIVARCCYCKSEFVRESHLNRHLKLRH